MRDHLGEFGTVKRGCKIMGIAESTFYHQPCREEKQLKRDLILKDAIEKIHVDLPGYGYRRVREHLLREGLTVNTKRIRRVMKHFELFSCLKKWLRPRGVAMGKQLRYPNLIRGLKLSAPNQVWATDITFIKLMKEFVYLSAVIDIYTRQIVGWSVSKNLSHEFCLRSLEVAIRRRKPPEGIIHHSDRGVQYVSEPYVDFLNQHGFKISMSKVGTPEDNAFIEAFFKTLKYEEVYFRNYQTMKDVINNLPRFIDEVYNTKRLHSSLGYKTPDEFEREILTLNPADRPVQKIWGRAL
ncbi:MAG: IS3 family transposase [Bdellovibrionia bacterium]